MTFMREKYITKRQKIKQLTQKNIFLLLVKKKTEAIKYYLKIKLCGLKIKT